MAFKYNGNTPKKITYNSQNVKKLVYNGVTVWKASSPFYWWQRLVDGSGNHYAQFASGYPTEWSVIERGCDSCGLASSGNFYMAENTLYCNSDCGGYIYLRASASANGCKKAKIYVSQTFKCVLKANGNTLYNFETQGNGNEYYGAGTYTVDVSDTLTLDLSIHGHGGFCYIDYVYFYD